MCVLSCKCGYWSHVSQVNNPGTTSAIERWICSQNTARGENSSTIWDCQADWTASTDAGGSEGMGSGFFLHVNIIDDLSLFDYARAWSDAFHAATGWNARENEQRQKCKDLRKGSRPRLTQKQRHTWRLMDCKHSLRRSRRVSTVSLLSFQKLVLTHLASVSKLEQIRQDTKQKMDVLQTDYEQACLTNQ